ncbi:MAG: hypothetical protein M3416_00820 [Acidobacteriota bacterium]|nr:hypothetical protein [Acidobacteriota bacterium]
MTSSLLTPFKPLAKILASLALLPTLLLTAGCHTGAPPEDLPRPPKEVQAGNPLPIPQTPEGVAVINHINSVYSVGPDAEANYQASLGVLRSRMNESVNILLTTYDQVDKKFYGDRWVLVQTLADLRGVEALDGLTRIANEPLPQRGPLYGHEISPYEEESVIRVTAIKGLGNLTVRDDHAARTLTTFFNHADPAIRLEAMNALAQAAREAERERRAALLQLLPRDYAFDPDPSSVQPPGIAGESPGLRPSGRGRGPAPSRPQ